MSSSFRQSLLCKIFLLIFWTSTGTHISQVSNHSCPANYTLDLLNSPQAPRLVFITPNIFLPCSTNKCTISKICPSSSRSLLMSDFLGFLINYPLLSPQAENALPPIIYDCQSWLHVNSGARWIFLLVKSVHFLTRVSQCEMLADLTAVLYVILLKLLVLQNGLCFYHCNS